MGRRQSLKKAEGADASESQAQPAARSKEEITHALGRIKGLEDEIAVVIREMREKVAQLEQLNDFAQLLNSSLDTDVVREKALEATCRLLQCETASLLLVDPKFQELYWETALGEAGKELQRSFRLPINEKSIAGWVVMKGEAALVNDVENDPRHFKKAREKSQEKGGFKTRTMICVPLKVKGVTKGVLQALNKLPPGSKFTDGDVRLFETLSHQVSIAVENSRLHSSIKSNFFNTVEALAEAIEKKDRYTGGHTKRVVYYSLCIAKHMHLSLQQLEQLKWSAVLHDIGKIGVDDKILKKQAPLEEDEWKVMQRHPEFGFDIMNRVDGFEGVIDGMHFHHERWDGKGYPNKLKGEQIPWIARIISVADTYDAMVSTRPYRKGLDPKFAHDEIVKHSGTQFAPEVVEAFRQAFAKEKMGKGSGGSSHGKGEDPTLSNCD